MMEDIVHTMAIRTSGRRNQKETVSKCPDHSRVRKEERRIKWKESPKSTSTRGSKISKCHKFLSCTML
jgi:hypothetical protein